MGNFFDTTKHWSHHAAMSDEELEARRRPLDYCEQCRYVLCSCGACHSQECRHTCSYETGYKKKDARS